MKRKRGAPLYARILALLQRQPLTTVQVAHRIGTLYAVNLRMSLRLLHRYGLVHVAGWGPPTPGGGKRPVVWGFGAGTDAAPVKGSRPPQPFAGVSSDMTAFVALVRALQEGPLTAVELAEITGYKQATVWGLLRLMREDKLVRVGTWDRSSKQPAAAYVYGAGKDAQRPAPENKRAIELRYYAKRKAREEQQRLLSALSANSSIFNLAQRA